MITCLAAFVAGASLAADPVALTYEVREDAAALMAAAQTDAAFYAALADFAADAESLSQALRAAGVSDDLPCIFHGIAEDAQHRAEDIQAAETDALRQMAVNGLMALLNDAVVLAPLAEEELTSRRP